MSSQVVRIGLLGCGTVGGGVVQLLTHNADRLADRVGARLVLHRVLVRDAAKPRVDECPKGLVTTDADAVLKDPDIDLVVEVVGGDDAAYDYIRRALEAGKGVVTANKLLLATKGRELLELAVANKADLAFVGAGGGGIPIVRTLREAFASDHVQAITGILNGTSNYVLTRMLDDGATMEDAIRAAQELGFAEADPSMDVGGIDAAHKLSILAMLGFGAMVDYKALHVEGITEIAPVDHRFAERFGYRIKQLAIGRDHGDCVELRVHPALVPERSVLANVSGVLNAVLLEGRGLGPSLVYGRGAGDLPTAVSVVSDVLDVARSIVAGVSGLQTRSIKYSDRPLMPMDEIEVRYYVRFTVRDEPGVMARLAGSLSEQQVSIEQLVQDMTQDPTEQADAPVTVVLLTHQAKEAAVQRALSALASESFMAEPPRLFRIENT
jgi:homoserine dehydrogenase